MQSCLELYSLRIYAIANQGQTKKMMKIKGNENPTTRTAQLRKLYFRTICTLFEI